MMKKTLGLMGLIGLLSACSPSEPTLEVSHYKANDAERETKLAWCNESADRKDTVNCKNAEAARRLLVKEAAEEKMRKYSNEGIPRK
ncbi:EexN family lipoprotein [Shewanella septentrionalis]|uniref:EexN family lipoprotein n=1 Tax=Shewanella septentrionalis TaxID=2952223 RepID=A0A9X3B3E7_9GAMM|nr:EexN family lipoprotein [Shewanella septentrionalis]MCT7947688.1 EexN family lipoprotein [Shewanella septentrionalis]